MIGFAVPAMAAGGEESSRYHWTWFSGLYHALEESGAFERMPFFTKHHAAFGHIGQSWFEAICFLYLTIAIMLALAWLACRRLERFPRGLQNVAEWTAEAMRSMTVSIIGPHGARYTPYIGTVFLFILLMNLWGIVPGGLPPTSTLSSTLALGVATFLYVQFVAIRELGVGMWLLHLGNWIPTKRTIHKIVQFCSLTWILFVLHVIGELVKPVTLSFRLFANIYGKEQIIGGILSLPGLGLKLGFFPVYFVLLVLAVVVSIVQAFLFSALTAVYISVFVSHEEEGHVEEGHSGVPISAKEVAS